MHAETGQPIYFWNRLLKGVVLQKPDFFVLPFMKPEKRQKHFLREGGFLLLIECLLQFHNFSGCLKIMEVIKTMETKQNHFFLFQILYN